MEKENNTPNYRNYLNLDALLNAQKLISEKRGKTAHDEMLFIITHQVYELWFKQILFEIDSIFEVFHAKVIDESQVGIAVSRLHRINEIIQLLIDQIKILETMTPMDFLEFRDLLTPASGFQSGQFRQIENKISIEHLKKKKSVISLGGGAFLNNSIRSVVKNSSISFWLDVSIELLVKRLKRNKKRPLLSNKNLNVIVKKIYLKRKKTYSEADFKVKCNFLKPDIIVKKILKLYESSTNKI